MEIYWGIVFAILVTVFAIMIFSKGKRKEYAVYQPNGDILHLWRNTKNFWFDWPGQMLYENEHGKRVIVGTHWYLRIVELSEGEWEKISADLQKKQEQEVQDNF